MVFRNYLAPIDDYTNLPFRMLCQRHGAEASCVPLVSAAALIRNKKAVRSVDIHTDEQNAGVQLVGVDPEQIGGASRMIRETHPHVSWLNINAGCPSAKTKGGGGGSALLASPQKIFDMVGSMRKTDLPVSVKIRVAHDAERTIGLCKMIEKAGADSIIIHGRTPEQGYCGKADWGIIKEVKESVGIPIVGNGDIKSSDEGEKRVREGYCGSYMIGRAAMADPKVFSGKKTKTAEERIGLLEEYLDMQKKYLGGPILPDAKAKAVNLLRGIPDAAAVRNRICRAKSFEEFLEARDLLGSDVP
ncbi:MAG: tRNA-dihydrouridine synthase family protein [Candidatus Micrarchaeota archaeon]